MSDTWIFENVFVFLLAAVYSLSLLKAMTVKVSRQAVACREQLNNRDRIHYENRAG